MVIDVMMSEIFSVLRFFGYGMGFSNKFFALCVLKSFSHYSVYNKISINRSRSPPLLCGFLKLQYGYLNNVRMR